MTKIRLYLDEDTQDNALILALRFRNKDLGWRSHLVHTLGWNLQDS